MKKVIFIFAVMLFLYSQLLIAENNPVPHYEFYAFPTEIMTSYYDYMPGGSKNYPIAPQTEYGDGTYLIFTAQAGVSSNRMIYGAFLDANGAMDTCGPLSNNYSGSGYGDIEVHPATGDGIATWHEDTPYGYGCAIALINDDVSFLPQVGFIYPTLPDEYLGPQIHKEPSPLGEDWIRYYHVSYNYNLDSFGNPNEDMRILYIDIENTTTADLTQLLNQANWTAIYPLYSWRDKSCRPFASFAVDYVNPGHVAIVGTAAWLEGDLGDMPVEEGAFVWESFDYGESWLDENLHSDGPGSQLYEVDNLPQFELPDGNIPDKLKVCAGGLSSTAIIDNEGNVHFPYLQEYAMEDSQGDYYYLTEFFPQAEFVWDGTDFIFRNVPAFPWIDIGGSGHDVPWGIDPTTGDTLFKYVQGHYFYDTPYPYGSVQTQSFSLDNKWMIQMWTDCTYHFFALNGIPGYDEYLEHPLITISASKDNGETWSEPLYLTDVHNPNYNFADQITVYPSTQKIIQDVNDNDGKFVIMYYDDNSFGSYAASGAGSYLGGTIYECIIQIDFGFLGTDEEPEAAIIVCQNYPNPFNTSTRISFSSKQGFDRQSEVSIYNTKGQLVKTLDLTIEEPQKGYAEWNGRDASGRNVANGIYFYKLSGSETFVGKMLLTR